MAVDGVQNLMKKLSQLRNMDTVAYKAVKRQAEVVMGEAVKLCPVYAGPWGFVPRGELRGSIYSKVEQDADATIGCVYTDKDYAPYVEFGTGPMGQSNHAGISPEVPVAYTQEPWVWADEDGGFHTTEGQPAQPFMYPALKNMENHVVEALRTELQTGIRKAGGGA